MKQNKPPSMGKRLDKVGIDAICDMIESGMSYIAMEQKIGIPNITVRRWIAADATRSARVRDAFRESAGAAEMMAESAILALQADSTAAEIAKARELAHHYRWRAAKRNPQGYGDKQIVEGGDNPIKIEGTVTLVRPK